MAIEKFVCSYWDSKKNTCRFRKREVMEFLNSVGATVKDGPKRDRVDPQKEWSREDWQKYNELLNTLASGIGGINLPTGKIVCGEGDEGVNQFCDQWSCEGKLELDKVKKENPNAMIFIKK